MRRSERVAAMTKIIINRPNHLFSLGEFVDKFQAAKSSISEDLDVIKESFHRFGMGRIETVAGAAGGVKYLPDFSYAQTRPFVEEICKRLTEPGRILPGGFLFMVDLLFDPQVVAPLGEILAARFVDQNPNVVLTIETKGIPIALMTARALGCPLVIARRETKVTEGPVVTINYVSGSSRRIQTMSLPRRSLSQDSRVVIVDDFMKGGGSAKGLLDLVAEFGGETVGVGVFLATTEPANKLVKDYISFIDLVAVDEKERKVEARPSAWLYVK